MKTIESGEMLQIHTVSKQQMLNATKQALPEALNLLSLAGYNKNIYIYKSTHQTVIRSHVDCRSCVTSLTPLPAPLTWSILKVKHTKHSIL